VPPGRNRAQPSRTARARPAATWAHGPQPRGRGPCSRRWRGPRARPTWPRPARAARDAHGGTARGGLSAAPHRRTGDCQGNGATHRRGDGGTAQRRRASGEAAGAARRRSGRRWLRTAAVGTRVVGTTTRGARRAAVRTATRGARRADGRHEAVTDVYLSSRVRVRTAPPTAANHGSARRDTATDWRTPRVSRISNLNKSL
jgi:hypothetical protein